MWSLLSVNVRNRHKRNIETENLSIYIWAACGDLGARGFPLLVSAEK